MTVVMSQADFDINHTICPSSGYPLLLHVVRAITAETLEEDCLVRVLSMGGLDANATFEEFGVPVAATVLCFAAAMGHEACIRLLLGAPGIDVNRPDLTRGRSPLWAAVASGHEACTRLLLGAPGIDVNQPDSIGGVSPLSAAASEGQDSCVEMLLSAPGIDVNIVAKSGDNVLTAACASVMTSLRQVGSADTTCTLVRLLASRQVSRQTLQQAISMLQRVWVSNAQAADAEAQGQSLSKNQEATRLLLPVLQAEALGMRRWCGHCWKMTPDQNLGLCTGCRQFGYCRERGEADDSSRSACQRRHWRLGGHRAECTAMAATAAAEAEAAITVEAADVLEGICVSEGKTYGGSEEGSDGGGGRESSVSGDGVRKKEMGGKKGKKGKKGRR